MKDLALVRDIDIATTLLVDALACLKRANAPAVAEHVMDALRQIEDDYGVVSRGAHEETMDGV